MVSTKYIEHKLKVNELAAKLPKRDNLPDNRLYSKAQYGLLDEVTDLVSLYIGEKEWGVMVKNAFDRTIRTYQRDRLAARDLIRVRSTDSDIYQWLVGGGITAALNARGAAKRTVQFDISSRYAKIYKGGLAVEFTDELRDSMSMDLMAEVMNLVVDAFDELETDIIIKALSAGVANGSTFTGIKHATHIFDASQAGYITQRLDHDKLLDMQYVMDNEGYNVTDMSMSLGLWYDLMSLEEWKDQSGNWVISSPSKALRIIEGEKAGQPLLPGISATRISVSPLHIAGQVVMYDKSEYMDFAVRKELSSEVAPHDGLHDVSMVTYRNRFGVASRNPEAAVKMINLNEISLTNKFEP
jgi:HK97 family phage major capsid protein